jgi:hypothetical protein
VFIRSRQLFIGLRMKVVAQVQKSFSVVTPDNPNSLAPFTKPLSRNALPFHVVIADAQMFPKISLGIFQTVLRLHRQHDGKLSHHLDKILLPSVRKMNGK